VSNRNGDVVDARCERALDWLIGSDPGLLRLRMAPRTTAALVCALMILYLLTRATGQPGTVALLGVLITMVSGPAVNGPDPRQQKITMGLFPLLAALAIVAGAAAGARRLAADIVFVVVVFAARCRRLRVRTARNSRRAGCGARTTGQGDPSS
jgi:small-conductance mechanosensitive channel